MLTQLVSRRAAEEPGTEGRARHSAAAEGHGPGRATDTAAQGFGFQRAQGKMAGSSLSS